MNGADVEQKGNVPAMHGDEVQQPENGEEKAVFR